MQSPTTRLRLAIALLAITAAGSTAAGAQSINDRLTSAARRATAYLAELSLKKVAPVDLEARGLTTTAFGVTVGVTAVQVLDTSALKIHAYLLNTSDAAIRIPILPEDSFAVVDTRGRKLIWLAAPKFNKLEKNATELVLPPLERVEMSLLYTKIPADAQEVLLKAGGMGIIRGIPLTANAPSGTGSNPSPALPSDGSGMPPSAVASGQFPVSPPPGSPSPSSSYPPPGSSPSPSSSYAPSGSQAPPPPAWPAPSSSPVQPSRAPSSPTLASLAGDWHEPTTLAAIHLNADGTYTTASGQGGGYSIQGAWVVFAGALSIWNNGRAVFSEGTIEFRWTDATGVEKRFVFSRR